MTTYGIAVNTNTGTDLIKIVHAQTGEREYIVKEVYPCGNVVSTFSAYQDSEDCFKFKCKEHNL